MDPTPARDTTYILVDFDGHPVGLLAVPALVAVPAAERDATRLRKRRPPSPAADCHRRHAAHPATPGADAARRRPRRRGGQLRLGHRHPAYGRGHGRACLPRPRHSCPSRRAIPARAHRNRRSTDSTSLRNRSPSAPGRQSTLIDRGDPRRRLGNLVEAGPNDRHNLVPLTLDVGEHGVRLAGPAARPDNPDRLGDLLADRLTPAQRVMENAANMIGTSRPRAPRLLLEPRVGHAVPATITQPNRPSVVRVFGVPTSLSALNSDWLIDYVSGPPQHQRLTRRRGTACRLEVHRQRQHHPGHALRRARPPRVRVPQPSAKGCGRCRHQRLFHPLDALRHAHLAYRSQHAARSTWLNAGGFFGCPGRRLTARARRSGRTRGRPRPGRPRRAGVSP